MERVKDYHIEGDCHVLVCTCDRSNDAAYGAIIPYVCITNSALTHLYKIADHVALTIQLEVYYQKSYTVVSLVFLSPFVGYTISAILSNLIHQTLGRRGITIIAPTYHVIAFAVISAYPPFLVLVIIYILVGLGSGFHNAVWNV
jgi:MFS family permease